jgi:hypothetical protein
MQDREFALSESSPDSSAKHSRCAGKQKTGRCGGCIDGIDLAFLLMNTIAAQREVGLAGRKNILIWTIICHGAHSIREQAGGADG